MVPFLEDNPVCPAVRSPVTFSWMPGEEQASTACQFFPRSISTHQETLVVLPESFCMPCFFVCGLCPHIRMQMRILSWFFFTALSLVLRTVPNIEFSNLLHKQQKLLNI